MATKPTLTLGSILVAALLQTACGAPHSHYEPKTVHTGDDSFSNALVTFVQAGYTITFQDRVAGLIQTEWEVMEDNSMIYQLRWLVAFKNGKATIASQCQSRPKNDGTGGHSAFGDCGSSQPGNRSELAAQLATKIQGDPLM